ncbi:MAG: DivIVA domain-containing protein [Acutalibacteraceae bacterium]
MNPNQIKNYPLVQVKQGLYRAADVESFRQKIYAAYAELYSKNVELKERFSSLADLVNEYNASKNSIASAIISAQTFANEKIGEANDEAKQIVEKANAQAEKIFEDKKNEADTYYREKKEEADKFFQDADTTREKVLNEIGEKSQKYIDEVNQRASEIINNANEQASKIVSRAYADAQKARQTSDEILESANKALPEIKTNVEKFRTDVKALIESLQATVSDISIPEKIEIVFSELLKEEEKIVPPEIKPFTYDVFPENKNEQENNESEKTQSDNNINDILNNASAENESEPEAVIPTEDDDLTREIYEKEPEIITPVEKSAFPKDTFADDDEDENYNKSADNDYIFGRFSALSDLFDTSDFDHSADKDKTPRFKFDDDEE